jgi:hypothetical protein
MTERRVGFPHPSTVKCADMLQAQGVGDYDDQPNQPLPVPYTPGRAAPESVGIQDPGDGITFQVIGDSGGVTDPNPQLAVAAALAADPADFVLSVGDADYYYGAADQWVPQFLEPYKDVQRPIVGCPGNHEDLPGGPPGAGIATWMAMFCSPEPQAPPADPDMEYGRHTETQPYVDWTLNLKAATLIGVWSNVHPGGNLYPNQQAWLTGELAAADPSLPVLVYMHHTAYSVDVYSGGSATLGATLDKIFEASRWPDLVIAGHIHNRQFFSRTRPGGTTNYLVTGAGGYRNLHSVAGDYTLGMDLGGGVTCEYADASKWGYLNLTVSGGEFHGEFVGVALDGTITRGEYTF